MSEGELLQESFDPAGIFVAAGTLQHFQQNHITNDDASFSRYCLQLANVRAILLTEMGNPDGAVDDDHRFSLCSRPSRMASRSPSQPIPARSSMAFPSS